MQKPMVILVGPSGVGKSSFLDRLIQDDNRFEDIITCTTRPMRAGEAEGNPYHFLTSERFEELLCEGYFVEWAKVHGKHYGTPRHAINGAWEANRVVIMDVDIQGAKTFKSHYPHALTVFILPPSIDVLRQRILGRDGETVQDLELRLSNALTEMEQADDCDFLVTNEDFEKAYLAIKKKIEEYLASE